MIVAITGASGFVGKHLAAKLATEGHTTRAASLRSKLAQDVFAGCDAVVHLAGEPVAQRWTAAAKQRIRDSRVDGTRAVVTAIASLEKRPAVLISASAVGYYGLRGDEILTEASAPSKDFLGDTSVAWEHESLAAEKLGVRVVNPRLGVVLGSEGGALAKMLPAFRMGVGGRIASGKQWMSWIHIDDLVSLILFAILHETVRGPLNAVASQPVTNAEFTQELAKALHRPAIFPVPEFALKLLFGEMSSILIGGQRVVPQAALAAGFEFRYSSLGSALAALFGSQRTSGTPRV